MVTRVALLATLLLTTGCKVVIDVPGGGHIRSESGNFVCPTNGRCELDIATTDFDETIVAVANAGFVFEGWRKRDRGLFGGSAGKARLVTKGFVGNADLMAVLASDETFYLEPVFRRVGTPENDPVFTAEPIVIRDAMEYYSDKCANPTIQSMIPVRLNNDRYMDFIVHYWCGQPADTYGTKVTGPALDALVAYISDGAGEYRADNQAVFGEDFIGLGGLSRKYVRGDLNGDGRDDFAFAMNWEDGRLGGPDYESSMTNATRPSVLLSAPGNRYEVHRLGERAWGHAVEMIDNNLGGVDVLFAGYTGESIQAFRYSAGRWLNVRNEYPSLELGAGHWANTVRALPATNPGQGAERIFGNYGADGEQGVALFRRQAQRWQRTSEWLLPIDFEAEIVTWQGSPGTAAVITLDGKQYLHGAVAESCLMPPMRPGAPPVLVGKFSAAQGTTPIIPGQPFDSSQLQASQTMLFFSFAGDRLERLPSPLVGEEKAINANFFDCEDINADGFSDLVVHAFTSGNDNRLEGGLSVYYLNNRRGQLVNIDRSHFPRLPVDRAQGFLFDVNGDHIMDLVLFEREANQHIGFHIFLGLRHMAVPMAD